MTDYTELKRLAEAATKSSGQMRVETDYNGVHQVIGDGGWKIMNAWHTPDGKGMQNAQFYAAASPAAVLDLIAENDRLRDGDQESTELCDTLSSLLGQVAVAVRGPEEPKSRHGFSDLPSRVKTVVAERDQLKAENEALRKGWYSDDGDNIRFWPEEMEALRREVDECAATLPGVTYMDPPDGGSPTIAEQLSRMAKDAERYRFMRELLRPSDWEYVSHQIPAVVDEEIDALMEAYRDEAGDD